MTSAIYIYYTSSWQQLADIVLPRVRWYCDHHKYELIVISGIGDKWAFDKMCYLSWYSYEFIWVLDLDTLITNPLIPFTQFVDNDHDIFITKDINGLNAGSWIARNTPAYRKFIATITDNFNEPHEQILMNKYLDMVKVKWMPQRSINSYKYGLYELEFEEGEWQPQDLLLHLPGLQLQQRIDILKGMM